MYISMTTEFSVFYSGPKAKHLQVICKLHSTLANIYCSQDYKSITAKFVAVSRILISDFYFNHVTKPQFLNLSVVSTLKSTYCTQRDCQ